MSMIETSCPSESNISASFEPTRPQPNVMTRIGSHPCRPSTLHAVNQNFARRMPQQGIGGSRKDAWNSVFHRLHSQHDHVALVSLYHSANAFARLTRVHGCRLDLEPMPRHDAPGVPKGLLGTFFHFRGKRCHPGPAIPVRIVWNVLCRVADKPP